MTRAIETTDNGTIRTAVSALALVLLLGAPAARGIVRPVGDAAIRGHETRHPDLTISNVYRPVAELPAGLAATLRGGLATLGVSEEAAFYDLRSGRWGTLMPSVPLIPGSGRGNFLSWADLGADPPASDEELGAIALAALFDYLGRAEAVLGLGDAATGRPTVTVLDGGQLVQIHVKRSVGGIPVRDSFLNAVVNHGNLVLLGTRNWGTVGVATQPAVAAAAAQSAVAGHLGRQPDGYRAQPELALVPMESGSDEALVPPGLGLTYRLVWVVRPASPAAGEPGRRWSTRPAARCWPSKTPTSTPPAR